MEQDILAAMRIFLSGPMGTGKSTVANELGRMLGLVSLDVDAELSRQEGATVSEIFQARGERVFRALEKALVVKLVAEHRDAVFALGGGTVTNTDTRRLLLESGVLVTLSAPVDELARRLASATDRPLLDGTERLQTLRTIVAERRAQYAECHGTVDAVGSPVEVAERVLRVVRDEPIAVALGERSYRVLVGAGASNRLVEELHVARAVSKVIMVTDETIHPLHGQRLLAALQASGLDAHAVVIEAGESAKHVGSVQRIWEASLARGVDRDAVVVGLGGGVVGDLAGFAAATILRGIDVVHLPTTLLAMVDSSIGGKTGFDTVEGKNLIGAFHQPRVVLSDITLLGTLPPEERRSGLAEVVKSAWLDGEAAVAQLERDAAALVAGEQDATVRAVRMAARLKARIVSGDEREGGARALLNLGHTVGHAIEASLGYAGMRHGEAVALGMVAAFRLARTFGRPAGHLERLLALLTALQLPTDVQPFLTPRVLAYMASDKKRGTGKLKFIVPGEPGATEVVPLPLDDIERRVTQV